jgi:hypothetical protein
MGMVLPVVVAFETDLRLPDVADDAAAAEVGAVPAAADAVALIPAVVAVAVAFLFLPSAAAVLAVASASNWALPAAPAAAVDIEPRLRVDGPVLVGAVVAVEAALTSPDVRAAAAAEAEAAPLAEDAMVEADAGAGAAAGVAADAGAPAEEGRALVLALGLAAS